MKHCFSFTAAFSCLALLTVPSVVRAETIRVAVASNFLVPLKEITAAFEKETDHKVLISSGSTGKIYAQIKNGAPYDLFLSADKKTVGLLSLPPTRQFVYARGKLVLYSRETDLFNPSAEDYLKETRFNRLAIANPLTAPYGRASKEVLSALSLNEKIRPKLIKGENISQTYQFVATGNAKVGFIAASQISGETKGSLWYVDEKLYSPIDQAAGLLEKGKNNPAALEFFDFLRRKQATDIIRRYGYGVVKQKEQQ